MIPPYSELVGKSLAELSFSKRYGLNVLALLRAGVASARGLSEAILQPGDRLLVEGSPRQIQLLRKETNLIVLSQLGPKQEDIVNKKSHLMLLILTAVIVLSILPWISLPMAAIMGALATIVIGAVSPQQAYEDVDWAIIIFIAALLPLGKAMENSGLAAELGSMFLSLLAGMQPGLLLATLFGISVIITQFLSNSVLALILTPIAIFIAQSMGLRPEPLVIAVMAGVSASFLTPITNVIAILLRAPGKYSFMDYVKINLPPIIVMGLAVVYLAPLVWPLH